MNLIQALSAEYVWKSHQVFWRWKRGTVPCWHIHHMAWCSQAG